MFFLLSQLTSYAEAPQQQHPSVVEASRLDKESNAPKGARQDELGCAAAVAAADARAAQRPDAVASVPEATSSRREGGGGDGGDGASSTAPAAAARSEERLNDLLNAQQCRACTSTRDLFAAFGSHMRTHGGGAGRGAGASSAAGLSTAASAAAAAATAGLAAEAEARTTSDQTTSASTGDKNGDNTAVHNGQQQQQQQEQQQREEQAPFWFWEEEMPEPPDVVDIGRATWTLLHTMAAYYPDRPTREQRDSMAAFVRALGDHYPCHECRSHLREELRLRPPDEDALAGCEALSGWACRLHNSVNARLGKPEFDCGVALARWRDGPPQPPPPGGGGGGGGGGGIGGGGGGGGVVYGLAAHNAEVDAAEAAAAAATAKANAPAVVGDGGGGSRAG